MMNICVPFVLLLLLDFTLAQSSGITAIYYDSNQPYTLDADIDVYDPVAKTAEFGCKAQLLHKNLIPASMEQRVGEKTTHYSTKEAKSYEKDDDGKISIGGPTTAEAGQLHVCHIEFADGSEDSRSIEINALDGSPIIWAHSSRYPDMTAVPYGAPFYVLYGYAGENATKNVEFSKCDPRKPTCKTSSELVNYEEFPTTWRANLSWMRVMTGRAVHSGFYTFKASNDKGSATAYYNLKVGEVSPASWADEATITVEKHEVDYKDNLTLICNFTSPYPYSAEVQWYINDRAGYVPYSVWLTTNGQILKFKHMTKRENGNYTCEIKFNQWTERVPPLRATTEVIVKEALDPFSGATTVSQLPTSSLFSFLLIYLYSLPLNM